MSAHSFRIGAVIIGLLACLSGAQPAAAHLWRARESGAVHRDLAYAQRDGAAVRLDLYLPIEQAGREVPLVVWLHGGGWTFGDKRLNVFVRGLTARGFAVASVDYRLAQLAKF